MAMTGAAKVGVGVGIGIGLLAIVGGASAQRGAAAERASSAACADPPATAARYVSRPRLRAWTQCVERTAEQAAECARLLDAAGRAPDAALVRAAWNARAQIAAATPDGRLTAEGRAEVDRALASPPSPGPDPAPSPAREAGGGKPPAAPGGRLARRVAPAAPAARTPPRRLPGRRPGVPSPVPSAPEPDHSTGIVTHGPELPPSPSHGPPVVRLPTSESTVESPEHARSEVERLRALPEGEPVRESGHGGGHWETHADGRRVFVMDPIAAGLAVVQIDAKKARFLSGKLARALRGATRGQHEQAIKAFQRAAGLPDDGRYSGTVYNALRFYGVNTPPPPLDPPAADSPDAAYAPTRAEEGGQ